MFATSLQSPNLRAVGYELWTSVLTIEFHSGAAYCYYDVPPVIYDRLVASDSPGRFLHQHIKGRYRFQRISTE